MKQSRKRPRAETRSRRRASDAGKGSIKPRKAIRTARDLVREGTKLLKRKRKKLRPEAIEAVEVALSAVTEQLPKRRSERGEVDVERLSEVTIALDEALTEHLGQYRKSVLREYAESIAWAVGLALIIRALLIEAFSIPSGSMIPSLEIGDHLFVNKIGYGIYWPFSTHRMVEWDQPERGDIIVFEFRLKNDPNDGEDFIKRVIGVPGDRLRLIDNTVHIDGEPVPTTKIGEGMCKVYRRNSDEISHRCHCVYQAERLGDTEFVTQHMDAARQPPNLDCRNMADWPLTFGEFFGDKANNVDWPEVVVPERHVFVMGDNRDRSQDGRYWGFVPYDRIKGKAFVIWYAREFSRIFTWLN